MARTGRLRATDRTRSALTRSQVRKTGRIPENRGRASADWIGQPASAWDIERLRPHAPEVVHDLPAGGKRLVQRSEGYETTLVAGIPVFEQASTPAPHPAASCAAGGSADAFTLPDFRRPVAHRDTWDTVSRCVTRYETLSHPPEMILSFRDEDTESLWRGEYVRRLGAIKRQALMRLGRLEAATGLGDLAALGGNRLEALRGSRQGQWSARVNDRWRVCFEWPQGASGPSNVEIVDYH